MIIHFHKSFWEAECTNEQELDRLLGTIKHEGYQGSELFLPFYDINATSTLAAHRRHGLNIITGIATDGTTASEHLTSLARQVEQAMTFEPLFINCHTGRDIFTLEENLMLFDKALALELKYGIRITHETHRFRPTFSTLGTEQILNHLPELKLNLDISHWMLVHESDLSDQQQRVEKLLANVHHIHARVGFEEGPQVTDPQDPRWREHLHNHTQLWQKVVDLAHGRGQTDLTITPEFGPFPYAHVAPHTDQAITDIWAANLFMQQHLKSSLIIPQ